MANELVKVIGGKSIRARKGDHYINATEMCKAAKKQWGHYHENKGTKEFLEALAGSIGIPMDLLVQTVKTGANEERGTWIHPRVVIHFAQWASAGFAADVTGWVLELITTGAVNLNRQPISPDDATMLRGEMAQVSNRLDNMTTTLAQIVARTVAEVMTQMRHDVAPLVGTETVASRLGRLLPHWNTTPQVRVMIRNRARANVKRAIGQEPLCVYPGSQLEFTPPMHYHLDTAILQTYREACEANEVDDYGLFRDEAA